MRVGFRPKAPFYRKYFWFYMDQHNTLSDFQIELGKSKRIKICPHLFQKSQEAGESAERFLERGASTVGMVYFEGAESYGGNHPRGQSRHARIKIVVKDPFRRRYVKKARLPCRTLSEAREFNPGFGATSAVFSETELQVELDTDKDGNLVLPTRAT